MAFDDAYAYAERLHSLGLGPSEDRDGSEIAIVREDKGQLTECEWLDFGQLDGHPVVWLAGTAPGPLAALDFERGNPESRSPLSPEDLRRGYKLLTRDQGVETYRENSTGKLIYMARTESGEIPVSGWRQFWRRLTGGQS